MSGYRSSKLLGDMVACAVHLSANVYVDVVKACENCTKVHW